MTERRSYKLGTRVSMDMGTRHWALGHRGTIVSPRNIKTDGRGIPRNVSGAYKPVDWSRYVAVKWDDGSYDVVAKTHIVFIGVKK